MASIQNGTETGSQTDLSPRPPRRRSWLLWLVLVILGLGLAYALLRPAPPEPAAEDSAPAEVQMQLLPSEVLKVATGPLRDTVQLTGSLAPARSLSLPAEVSGRVGEVRFRVGQSVKQGDELITIDIEALRNRLEQQRATAEATRAQLNLARAQQQRADDLVKRGVSSISALETETANVAQLEANHAALLRQVETAEDDLFKSRITAPFDGVIAARSVDPGTYVTVGTEMLSLVDITAMDLEGGVPVVYAPLLRTGQVVELVVDGLTGQSFTGEIERISPIAVTGTRVLPVFARIGNDTGQLRGGMFAVGDLVLAADEGIGIPAEALREDETGQYVLKITEGRVVRQPVEVARTWDRGRTVQIASGLSDGAQIVAMQLERLQDGMAVQLLER